MKLEELARQSSVAARASVAHLDPPPVGRPERQRSWMPVLAGVAVCALIVGGLYAILRYTGDDTADFSEPMPVLEELPRLGLPTLEGWTVNAAGSFADFAGDTTAEPTFTYYGDPESDDPFADGDLLVAVFTDAEQPPITPQGEIIEVRGTSAGLTSGSDQGLPADALSIEWYEVTPDGSSSQIVVVSRTFDRDRLVAIVESLEIDAETGAVAVPDEIGLERLSSGSGTPLGAFRGASEGYLVVYQGVTGNDALLLSSTRADLDDEVRAMQWWTDDIESATVSGRPAYVIGFDDSMPDLGTTVIWSYSDGVVATLAGIGEIEGDDLLALAELAVPVDDETWESYVARARQIDDASLTEDFSEVYGRGEGAIDGESYTWAIGQQDADLCFQMRSGSEGTGSCQPRSGVVPPAGSAVTIDNQFGSTLASVVIAADPAVTEVVETTGTWDVHRVDADGIAWIVAIGRTDVQPTFDVVVDGSVVATLEAAVVEMAEDSFPVPDGDAQASSEVRSRMTDVLSNTDDDAFQWWFGTDGDRLCLAVDGISPSGTCSPSGDVTVLPTVWSPEGEVTFVVLRDVPECIESVSLDGATVDFIARGADGAHRYEVIAAFGPSAGWTVRLAGNGGTAEIDAPSPEGAADWSPFLCDG